jgi:4-amino-4-deoxy-L-arabinose transferase-like glycosyltransferase
MVTKRIVNVFEIRRIENLLLVFILIISPVLAFYNLEYNPRPWHDEGSYLALAKTLVEDGIYAVRNAGEYQTFGPVQSLGPTVILPIAWVFRYFGVGLVQGRVVSAAFLLLTLIIFTVTANALFGRRVAILAYFLVLGSPAAGILIFGRPVLGEVAAFGLFLSGYLLWRKGISSRNYWFSALSGLLFGAAILTKSQYLLMISATYFFSVLIDWAYYKTGSFGHNVLSAIPAYLIFAIWTGWQINYYGAIEFQENIAKLSELAGVTTGFNFRTTIEAFRYLFGEGSGYFYFYWGLPAVVWSILLVAKRETSNYTKSFLVIFTVVWLVYFTFWIIPWSRYILPAAAVVGILTAKLILDILESLVVPIKSSIKRMIRKEYPLFNPQGGLLLGALVACITVGFASFYQFQKTVRSDVLDKIGAEKEVLYSPAQFQTPHLAAQYLNENIPHSLTIETWERELSVLTDHRYHFPDQSLLAQSDRAIYLGQTSNYRLGAEYFKAYDPKYLVLGWYTRFNQIYDMEYVEKHATLIASIGEGDWRYDFYRFEIP